MQCLPRFESGGGSVGTVCNRTGCSPGPCRLRSDTCPWNPFNFGLDASKPTAQAYYDSLAEQFAAWGVDFLKVDCISDHPYKGDEIRLVSQALAKLSRPIVLSLSPGPTSLEKAEEVSKYAHDPAGHIGV